MDEAFCRAASVSSTVNKTVVWIELSAPPEPAASGAFHDADVAFRAVAERVERRLVAG
jgi:hypothetical protein